LAVLQSGPDSLFQIDAVKATVYAALTALFLWTAYWRAFRRACSGAFAYRCLDR